MDNKSLVLMAAKACKNKKRDNNKRQKLGRKQIKLNNPK
jgi:hypothetical protein